MNGITIVEALQRAIEFQRKGMLPAAEQLYRQVLAVDAKQPDALHLLGLIESSKGNHGPAISLIRSAVQVMPKSDTFWSNLGVVLKMANQIPEAIDAYQRAIELNPSNADARFNLGKSLKSVGKIEDAEKQFLQAIQLDRNRAAPWLSLMALYSEVHDRNDAVVMAAEAERIFPNNAEILLNVGAIRKRSGDLERALVAYKHVLVTNPDHVDALCRAASTCFSMHRIDEGLPLLERARRLSPHSEHVQNCLGSFHNTLGNATEAVKAYRLASDAQPNHGTAHCNLGSALRKLGELSEALASADRSVEMEKNNAEFLAVRAGIRLCLGMHDGAESDFRSAVAMRHGNYKDAHQSLMMCLQYKPGIYPEALQREHQAWVNRFAVPIVKASPPYRSKMENRPIRIGFVSPDLGAHPVGYFSARLFAAIDRQRFQTYVYSDRLGDDWLKEILKKDVHCWRDTIGQSDEKLAQQVHDDQIDILFDLAGHTSQNRLLLFAKRVAPLQVTWAGYVGSTGIPEMDCLLADRFQIAVGTENFYTEKILRMPDDYVTYYPPNDIPDVEALPAINKGFITFGAMCNPAKVNDTVLESWGRILQSLPKSRLLLCYNGWPDRGNRDRVARVLDRYGCEQRVEYGQTTGASSLMQRYNQVDIALDTFPYSGGLTTIEAMWMGVPTITWPQSTFAGRHSLTHLSNVGLMEWVADSQEGYEKFAIEKARDLDSLSRLRKTLRDRVLESPLCDGPRFARCFEELMISELSQSPWLKT